MASKNLTKLHSVKGHRGISYRERANGSRRYYVFFKGSYVSTTDDGQPLLKLDAAVERKGQLTGHRRRGEEVRRPEKVTFAAAAEAYMEDALNRPKRPLRQGTANEYQRYLDTVLIPRFGQRLIGSIRSEEIEKLTAELMKKHPSESTVGNTLKPLHGVFKFAHRQKKWIPRKPVEDVADGYRIGCNATRPHHEWTTADVDRLIEVGYERDARPGARRDYGLAIEMLLRLGLRLGELLGLQFGDFVADGPVCTIERSWTQHGRVDEVKTRAAVRRVPLTPGLHKKIIERKLRLGAGDEDFIFASERGGRPPLQGNFRKRGWDPAREEAGLVGGDGIRITPHDARHAFVSQVAHLGLSSAQVAPLVGHKNTRVTEGIYTHAFDRRVEEEKARQMMLLAEGAGS